MKARFLLPAAAVVALAAARWGAAGDEPATPDLAAEVLAKIDAALFFPDAQPGLAGYECDLGSNGTVAHARLDAATGTKTWTTPDGKDLPPGTWAPVCDSWGLAPRGLGDVVPWALELFSSPLAKRFDAEHYLRDVLVVQRHRDDDSGEKEDEGWWLTVTKKDRPAGDPEIPAFVGLRLVVGKDGVPVSGVLGLATGGGRGEHWDFVVTFEAEGALRRVASIVHGKGGPGVDTLFGFCWEKQGEHLLLASVAFRGPMGGASLSFENYVVKTAEKTAPPAEPPPAVEPPPAPGGPKYVGDGTCKKCHFVEHKSWKAGRLAKSLDTLRPTDEGADAALFAKKKAAGLDPAKDYSADPACVRCHVTGLGRPGGYPADPGADEAARALAATMGKVSCEACHGPGEAYVEHKVKQGKANVKVTVEELIPLGLVKPTAETCAACHNADSPTKAAFSFEEAKGRAHEHKKR